MVTLVSSASQMLNHVLECVTVVAAIVDYVLVVRRVQVLEGPFAFHCVTVNLAYFFELGVCVIVSIGKPL